MRFAVIEPVYTVVLRCHAVKTGCNMLKFKGDWLNKSGKAGYGFHGSMPPGIEQAGYERNGSNKHMSSVFDGENRMQPLVQVIIPTYKRPGLFKEALLSVLAQSYRNIVIFVTDNSDDEDTKTLIRPFLEMDQRITYEHHPEYTEQDNWNRGMEMTRPDAEYINWLMDDDLFFPTKIEEMVNIFQENEGLSLVSGSRLHIDLQGNPIQSLGTPNLPVKQDTRFPGAQAAVSILKNQCNYIGEPTTAMIRRECLLDGSKLGWTGREGRYFLSDLPTWLHALEQGDLYFLKKPLSAFRLHEEQVGKRLSFIIRLQGTWAYLIHHAITTGTFLTNERDIRETVVTWLENTSSVLRHAEATGYAGEDLCALQTIFSDMESSKETLEGMRGFRIQT